MRVAIHQPNFFPWLGIFHRISQVDRFIFFDHVQAPRGKSWFTRNKVLVGGEPKWLTLPVYKAGCGKQAIGDVRINYGSNFTKKHLKTLELNYGRLPFFEVEYPGVVEVYEAEHEYVADLNMSFVRTLCGRLGYDVEFVKSSDLIAKDPGLGDAAGNDLVLGICQAVGASRYLSGTGCLDFICPETFEPNGIQFAFQEFVHPTYPQQRKEFQPNLSVLDALFTLGAQGVQELLRPGNS